MSGLNINIQPLLDEITRTTSLEASAKTLIEGFAAQVTAAVTSALEADNSADQASIDAAVAAINAKKDELLASNDALASAIAEGGGNNPAPPVQ